MSLNRTLRRLFVEVRREARRNPEFAGRLDAALRAYAEASAADASPIPVLEPAPEAAPPPQRESSPVAPAAGPELNPVALLVRDGEDALTEALISLPDAALHRLLGEHNLDPAGAAEGLAGPGLVAHIVAQAQKRVERDRKLFDY